MIFCSLKTTCLLCAFAKADWRSAKFRSLRPGTKAATQPTERLRQWTDKNARLLALLRPPGLCERTDNRSLRRRSPTSNTSRPRSVPLAADDADEESFLESLQSLKLISSSFSVPFHSFPRNKRQHINLLHFRDSGPKNTMRICVHYDHHFLLTPPDNQTYSRLWNVQRWQMFISSVSFYVRNNGAEVMQVLAASHSWFVLDVSVYFQESRWFRRKLRS